MTRDDKQLPFMSRMLWLPLIPKTPVQVKNYLGTQFPFSDGPFRADAERILKIGRPSSGDLVVRFRAAEFRRNATGEYHYTGRTIRAVTFDLSEVAGWTCAKMILYDPGAIPFAVAIVHRIGEDFSQLRVATDELCSELERLKVDSLPRQRQTRGRGKPGPRARFQMR